LALLDTLTLAMAVLTSQLRMVRFGCAGGINGAACGLDIYIAEAEFVTGALPRFC